MAPIVFAIITNERLSALIPATAPTEFLLAG